MVHDWLKRSDAEPGLGTQNLNRKFERIFPRQVEVDYTAYTQAKRPAAKRWASTWGRTFTRT
ncbi:MAG: hypothetical protein ACE3NC_10470 [Candidatus Wallacebacter cryptica]|jgi:hypothetical protein|nr:hypothetical protein [Bacillota bacterium]